MLASGIEQSDSVICIYPLSLYIYRERDILFQILFHYKLLQDTEYSSLCCTVDPVVYLFYSCECPSVMSNSLRPHWVAPTRLLCPWDFPGKNSGVCCHSFLQGNFPSQELNPGLRHCWQILYRLSHQGNSSVYMLVQNS